jgi:hypothetical protein
MILIKYKHRLFYGNCLFTIIEQKLKTKLNRHTYNLSTLYINQTQPLCQKIHARFFTKLAVECYRGGSYGLKTGVR